MGAGQAARQVKRKQKSCSTVGDGFDPLKAFACVRFAVDDTTESISSIFRLVPRSRECVSAFSISGFASFRLPMRTTTLAFVASKGATPAQASVRNAQYLDGL